MNVRVGMRISACVTGLVVVAVLAILIPSTYWMLCSGLAAALVGLSIAAPPFVPLPAPKRASGSDATGIWLVGPMGIWLGVLVLVAAIALWLALHGVSAGAWAMMVIWGGLCIAGWVSLRASTDVVARASAQTQCVTGDARAQWLGTLSALSVQTRQTESKHVLDGLTERIRYAANDNPHVEVAQNSQINSLVSQLDGALDNSDELNRIARSIEGLLVQREHAIRATRSFA